MAAPAQNVQFLNDFLMKFDTAVVSYWQNLVSSVVSAISPVATSLLGIYIILWGWSMLRGHIQEPVMDGLGRLTRLAMIVSVALSVGYYNSILANWISQTPDYLASLGTAGGGGTSATLTQYADQVAEQLLQIWDAMGKAFAATGWTTVMSAFPTVAVGILMFIAILLLLIYIVFLLILSKMAIAILIGVGPIFVLSLIFESSKNWFSMWWAQVLNYSFLALLAGAAGALVLQFIMQYLTAANLPNAIAAGQGFTSAMVPPIALAGIGSPIHDAVPHRSQSPECDCHRARLHQCHGSTDCAGRDWLSAFGSGSLNGFRAGWRHCHQYARCIWASGGWRLWTDGGDG